MTVSRAYKVTVRNRKKGNKYLGTKVPMSTNGTIWKFCKITWAVNVKMFNVVKGWISIWKIAILLCNVYNCTTDITSSYWKLY